MTAPTIYSIVSDSPERTRQIAAGIGRLAPAGLVVTLSGDLGSGKTCFVQGLARGLGVAQGTYVTSPSYTLVNTYQGRLLLHHVDLYRLSGGEGSDIGLEELMEAPAVTAVEWSERLPEAIPPERLCVDIRFLDEDTRRLELTAYGLAPSILLKELSNVI
jgi:tRNA threonylcarbamoyladenosine biosynthesis protein TsaE